MWRAFWHAWPTYYLSYVPTAVNTGRNTQYAVIDFCMYSIFTDCLRSSSDRPTLDLTVSLFIGSTLCGCGNNFCAALSTPCTPNHHAPNNLCFFSIDWFGVDVWQCDKLF